MPIVRPTPGTDERESASAEALCELRTARRLSRPFRRATPPIDHSESPETERKATEPHQHEITLATPLYLRVHVGNPRVEFRLVMGAAAYAIANPLRQHLAAGDALSWPIVGLAFLEPHA